MLKMLCARHNKVAPVRLCLIVPMLLWVLQLPAQINEPTRLKFGASIGAGGLHLYAKPSFDLHYGGTAIRFSPGLFYLSGGISQQIGYYRKRVRQDRPLFLHFSYHDDYFLTNIRRRQNDGLKYDQDMYMLTLGIRAKLDYLRRVYFEFAVGGMLLVEKYRNGSDGTAIPNRNAVYPMVEVRLGGVAQSHKMRHQYQPDERPTFFERLAFWRRWKRNKYQDNDPQEQRPNPDGPANNPDIRMTDDDPDEGPPAGTDEDPQPPEENADEQNDPDEEEDFLEDDFLEDDLDEFFPEDGGEGNEEEGDNDNEEEDNSEGAPPEGEGD